MCEPTPQSTSLPEPTGPTDEQYVYHLTAEGKKALEAHEKATGKPAHAPAARVAAVADALTAEARRMRRRELGRKCREKGRRVGTVSGLMREGKEALVPSLRLRGDWLGAAGFEIGRVYEVAVDGGQLTIRVVE